MKVQLKLVKKNPYIYTAKVVDGQGNKYNVPVFKKAYEDLQTDQKKGWNQNQIKEIEYEPEQDIWFQVDGKAIQKKYKDVDYWQITAAGDKKAHGVKSIKVE